MVSTEEILSPSQRERIRQDWLAEAGFYSPWLHLVATTLIGGTLGALGLWVVRAPRWWDVVFAVAIWILANASEWRLHRDFLHKRQRLLPAIYQRHTPQHHMVFITDDFAVRSRKEWRLVLIPPWAILLLFVTLLPMLGALWWAGLRNQAGLFAFVTMFYVVSYEWLHLAYHQPETTWIGRTRLMTRLRRHHQVHHDPRLMQRWNFNVVIPLWDLVRGTYVASRDEGLARDKERRPVRTDRSSSGLPSTVPPTG